MLAPKPGGLNLTNNSAPSDGPDDPPQDVPEPASRTTLRNFPFAMVLTDPHQPDNPIIYVNRKFTSETGYAFEAAVGRNCRFLQGENTDPAAVAKVRKAVDERREFTVDLMNYRADGSPFHNRLLISPLYDSEDQDELLYFLGVQTIVEPLDSPFEHAADLTEQLRELQHRVKNHLAMVLGMLRTEARSRPPEEVIDVLRQRIEAISLLYDSLSNTDTGASETVDLGAYLSRVASALQIIDSRPSVLVNVAVESVHVTVDLAAHTGLYLSEVMTNAFRHGLRDRLDGEISVSLERERDSVVLAVIDNGVGMGDANWPDGSSIGSAIVRDLVYRTKADLSVKECEGTEVALRIPIKS